jgi:selenocysteine lyase/cysteine desulfurase
LAEVFMARTLYLDTARLGRMLPQAQAASISYMSLAGEIGCSVRFEDLLYEGFQAWDHSLRRHYNGLSAWQGLSTLKDSLRALTGAGRHLPVFLASRSAELMRLSARLLFRKCRKVLLSDLEWPAYRAILEQEGRRTGGEVKQIPLRQFILGDQASKEEVAALVSAYYQREGCQGLFLSSISYEGIHLPVKAISRSLAHTSRPPFVVVDGAQALCHAPAELEDDDFDFFLAGCHKWLRAFHPMGIGFCGREASQDFVESVSNEMIDRGELDDPLLQFTSWMEAGTRKRFTETVSIGPLFSCAAAVKEVLARTSSTDTFSELVRTAQALEEISLGTGWTPVVSHDELRSGILLLRSDSVKRARPEEVREQFQECGIALTAYEGGVIRLSAPPEHWQEKDAERLRFALETTALGNESAYELSQAC